MHQNFEIDNALTTPYDVIVIFKDTYLKLERIIQEIMKGEISNVLSTTPCEVIAVMKIHNLPRKARWTYLLQKVFVF